MQYAFDNGIIDEAVVQEQVEMKKREELLSMHPYKISCGKDGFWRTYIPDESKSNGRKQIKKKSEEAIKQAVIDYWKQQTEDPTIEEVFTEWNDRQLELHNICEATHMRNKQTFNRHYQEFGKRRIKSVSAEDFQDFLEEQIPKFNLKAKAFSNLKTITKKFLIRAKKEKLIDFNIEEMFFCLDVSDRAFDRTIKEDCEEAFSREELVKVIRYLINNSDVHNVGLLVACFTGIRVGELVGLKHEDFGENEIKIRRTETRYKTEPKGQHYEIKERPKTRAGIRNVPIPKGYEWIADLVKKTNPFGEYVFVKDGKRMHAECFRKRLYRICDNLGIPRRSPHKLRKTFTSLMVEEQVGCRLLTEILGHTDIATTERYYHRETRTKEEKAGIIGKVFDGLAI